MSYSVKGIKRLGVGGLLALAVFASIGGGTALADGISGLTVPAADPVLQFVAPNVDQPNYQARLDVFLQATVPETWNGQPVGFLSALSDAGGVDVMGLPTSEPKADPNNPSFVYQRFQNGVLFYNATEGSTQVLGL
jgi:hypothetical protein